MNEFIEKLIGRLEELKELHKELIKDGLSVEYHSGCKALSEDAIEIVNQLAEEYKHCTLCYLQSTCEYQNENAKLPNKLLADENGWISVSERLPELTEGTECFKQSKCCLVTLKWWDGDMTESVGWYNQSGVWSDDSKNCNVVAWMPLPEPFKPIAE